MTHEFPAIDACESVLDSPDELLFRQITKHKWNEVARVPSSSAFGPADADKGKPSFSRSGVNGVTEQSSRDWHQNHARTPSLGVWATTVAEVQGAELRTVEDADCPVAPEQERAPGHCYVDYRDLTRAKVRDARAELLLRALARGELPTTDCLADDSEAPSIAASGGARDLVDEPAPLTET